MCIAVAAIPSCATRKYVRTTVGTSADTLNARIDNNEVEMKEMKDECVTLDVREDIRNGREPFGRIMEAVDALRLVRQQH